MILYFTGTGNSKYVAEEIAKHTGDFTVSINSLLKEKSTKPINADGKLVFVVPTYAWRIPKVVYQWIMRTEFLNMGNVWFIQTCGGEIGNSPKYIEKLCKEKVFNYMGTAEVVMPDNYIIMFTPISKEEAERRVEKSKDIIKKIAEDINLNKAFETHRASAQDKVTSGLINRFFYSFCVSAKGFKSDDKCVGCGKCAKVCPLNNITIQNGKPLWGKECTQCMACISYCPKEAIEYGKKTVGKARYRFENREDNK